MLIPCFQQELRISYSTVSTSILESESWDNQYSASLSWRNSSRHDNRTVSRGVLRSPQAHREKGCYDLGVFIWEGGGKQRQLSLGEKETETSLLHGQGKLWSISAPVKVWHYSVCAISPGNPSTWPDFPSSSYVLFLLQRGTGEASASTRPQGARKALSWESSPLG